VSQTVVDQLSSTKARVVLTALFHLCSFQGTSRMRAGESVTPAALTSFYIVPFYSLVGFIPDFTGRGAVKLR
jgi:hypothetical protein